MFPLKKELTTYSFLQIGVFLRFCFFAPRISLMEEKLDSFLLMQLARDLEVSELR